MPRLTICDNRFALLRATYDAAFAGLCYSRRELDVRREDNLMEDVFLRLQRNFEVWQAVYTRTRNDLATCILERYNARQHMQASHAKLIVGSPANRSIIPHEMGA
jgi:hypothetical protein